jgi:hypothetical protein
MKTKLSAVILIAFFAALFSGCSSTRTSYGKREMNMAGIIKVERGSYSKAGPLTIRVKASDFIPRASPTGDRVRLLAGLITIED